MNNPSAFPLLENSYGSLDLADPGMTLRDYFAAKAMQSFVAKVPSNVTPDQIAWSAYQMANAMLIERAIK